jgi:hypothetical protein
VPVAVDALVCNGELNILLTVILLTVALAPVMLPVALTVCADMMLAPVILPDVPEVMMLLEVMLPVVLIELLPKEAKNVATFALP